MKKIVESLQMKNDLVNIKFVGHIPQIYRDTMDLYFKGMDYKEIAKTLGISENVANTRLSRLRCQGLIGRKQTKVKTVMEFLKIGIKDNKEIADLLDISYVAASKLKTKAYIRLQEYEKNLGITAKTEVSILAPELIPEVKELLSYRYPIEIASAYNVSVREVYNIIYSLTDEEKRNIKTRALNQNNLYKKIKNIKENENVSAREATDKILNEQLSVQDKLDLARLYYIFGNTEKAQKILMKTVYNKKVDIGQRILAREEADKMYFNDVAQLVRRDYITRKPNGELIYFDDLTKKYKVGYTFLTEVIGPEDEIDFDELEL